jgi:hypothetical protein
VGPDAGPALDLRPLDGGLAELAERLRAEGDLLSSAVRTEPRADDVALDVPERFAVAVAAIREGYLLHYGDGRLLAVEDDDDAALLAGDRLYALGLAELAEIGEIPAVRAMADVIDRCAVAHAAGDTAAARRAWEIGTRALGADR